MERTVLGTGARGLTLKNTWHLPVVVNVLAKAKTRAKARARAKAKALEKPRNAKYLDALTHTP